MTPERDDDFEQRLRDVLRGRQLEVPTASDALERVHAGARRRQQRRLAVSATAALAVVAVAAGGVALRGQHATTAGHKVVAGSSMPTAVVSSATAAPSADSSGPVAISSPAPSPSAPSTTAPSSSPPTLTLAAGGPPPSNFVPVSVTAVNKSTYWVLGHAACGDQTCTGVAKTTDGGQTFTLVGAPASALVPDAPDTAVDLFGTNTISDIRFGNGQDGWAYGGGLWQTADGGMTWSRVSGLDGSVQRLAAANGRAWAVVFEGAPASAQPTYALYTTTYPGGSWAKVSAAGEFGPSEPNIALQDGTVTVIGTSAPSDKDETLVATGNSTSLSVLPAAPCDASEGGSLSVTKGGLWLACGSGQATSGVYFSPGYGSSWQQVPTPALGTSTVIGAVDTTSAIAGVGAKLLRIGVSGSSSAVAAVPNNASATAWTFIGFTESSDGFAIPVVDNSRQLWRTTDGGAHWTLVTF